MLRAVALELSAQGKPVLVSRDGVAKFILYESIARALARQGTDADVRVYMVTGRHSTITYDSSHAASP